MSAIVPILRCEPRSLKAENLHHRLLRVRILSAQPGSPVSCWSFSSLGLRVGWPEGLLYYVCCCTALMRADDPSTEAVIAMRKNSAAWKSRKCHCGIVDLGHYPAGYRASPVCRPCGQ